MRPGQHKRVSNWAVGLIAVALVAIGTAWAFTKELPWTSAYEVQAIFPSAQNVRVDSPVRIAGADVGKVTGVQHLDPAAQESFIEGDEADEAEGAVDADGSTPGPAAAVVTMEITEQGRPIKSDATFALLPRLFLEGNLLVDLKPGSPSAPEVDDGHVFPLDQTSNSVQIDQILTTLQKDVRSELQVLLDEFGSALVDHGGAEGFQELYRSSPGANKFTSQVNEAFLGTEPHDLSGLVRNLDRVVRGLGRNEEELKGLVSNFATFTGSFAAEDTALRDGIRELPRTLAAAEPAYAALNRSFPPLRAFSREALPGVRSTPETLDAATPWLRQIRKLVSRDELRGLTADLRPAIPDLAELTEENVPFLEESRALASCFNEVIIPWSHMTVPDPEFPATGHVFEETGYGLVGIAGESRSGDANGQYVRVLGQSGTNLVKIPQTPLSEGGTRDEPVFGLTPFNILGARPAIDSSLKTPFRPGAPCERQEPPNLSSEMGAPPEQEQLSTSGLPGPAAGALKKLEPVLRDLAKAGDGELGAKRSRRIESRAEKDWAKVVEDYQAEAREAFGGGG